MANFKGVADITRDYQKSIVPWDDNKPVSIMKCRGCGGQGIRAEMEIARLKAICLKTDCGPLQSEIVRLRAQIATLEERKTGDSESEAEEEMEFASQADADGELARKDEKLEAAEKENGDLDSKNVDLQSKNGDLEIEILKPKSELASPPPCEDCVEHKLDYKDLSGRYHQELEEGLQQDIRIIDLEHQIQLLKDDLAYAYGPMGGSVAGFGDDLSAEEQSYQQAKQQHSS
jgi:hypothetical protein